MWKPVHYKAEPHLTRSGRVLNPPGAGWCPTLDCTDGRPHILHRHRPSATREACQAECDLLNKKLEENAA